MRNLILLLAIISPVLLTAQTPARDAYINRFKKIAISEMERTGVPASIKLAQGILESGDGKSTLARKANNHFGIKCHSSWKGKTHYIEDDDYDENGKIIKSCFRVYKNANSSYIAHSEFLRNGYRYEFLFRLSPTDYRGWARGLKQAGYATSPTYAEKLIRVIEASELHHFDKMSSFNTPGEEPENPEFERLSIKVINDVKVTLANNNETAVQIAERTNTKLSRILKYNDRISNKNQKIKKDTKVYLQRKRNNFRGKKKWHYVKEGQTMYEISQLYGVSLKKLKHKNRIPDRKEPQTGERIRLRGWFKVSKNETPKLRSRSEGDIFEDEGTTTEEEEFIDIEVPTSNADDEEFDEDIVPETPDSEIFDEPVTEEEVEEEEEDPGLPDEDTTTEEDPQDTNSGNNPTETGVYYTVVKGDTLFSISRKYGITVEAIKRLNNLQTNTISIGQRLRVF